MSKKAYKKKSNNGIVSRKSLRNLKGDLAAVGSMVLEASIGAVAGNAMYDAGCKLLDKMDPIGEVTKGHFFNKRTSLVHLKTGKEVRMSSEAITKVATAGRCSAAIAGGAYTVKLSKPLTEHAVREAKKKKYIVENKELDDIFNK